MSEARPRRRAPLPKLAARFGVPPFSLLDARQGYWRDRKAAWLSLGVAGELGRKEGLAFNASCQPASLYHRKDELEAQLGQTLSWAEFALLEPNALLPTTSEFDPVLAELA